jgi:hypothetical protein
MRISAPINPTYASVAEAHARPPAANALGSLHRHARTVTGRTHRPHPAAAASAWDAAFQTRLRRRLLRLLRLRRPAATISAALALRSIRVLALAITGGIPRHAVEGSALDAASMHAPPSRRLRQTSAPVAPRSHARIPRLVASLATTASRRHARRSRRRLQTSAPTAPSSHAKT